MTQPIVEDGPITEALIERVVREFYRRVRADADLGPIFSRVIGADWEPHLHVMFDFWSSLLRRTGRYGGQPMRKHLVLADVTPAHFERWLSLFRATCGELCTEDQGAAFIDKAERVAKSFQLAMFYDPVSDRRPLGAAPDENGAH